MVLQVAADAGQMLAHFDTQGLQLFAIADA